MSTLHFNPDQFKSINGFVKRKVPTFIFSLTKKMIPPKSCIQLFSAVVFLSLVGSCQKNAPERFIKNLKAYIILVDSQVNANEIVDWGVYERKIDQYKIDFQSIKSSMHPDQRLTVEALFLQYRHIRRKDRYRKAQEKIEHTLIELYEWISPTSNL